MPILAKTVRVTDPETNRTVVLHKGADVPDRVVALVDDPDAWQDAPAVKEEPEPPRTGRGSGRDAWAAYAAAQGLEVDAEASRDDIIAALSDDTTE